MNLQAQKPLFSWKQWLPLFPVLIVGLLLAQFFYLGQGLQPQEDAAMLFRYAKHFAEGNGIVWNVGDSPVDGATDFLFMVFIAAFSKIGIRIELAAMMLTISAHFVVVAMVYRLIMRQGGDNRWAASFAALVVMTGPGLSYCEAGFGTTVFALAGLITFQYFLRMLQNGFDVKVAQVFALSGLVTGLIRPEGVLLSLGMLSALFVKMGPKERQALLIRFALVFGIPGAIYFAWHWYYFGYPLPNPFYVKGGGRLYLSSFNAALIGIGKMSMVLVPFLLLGIWKRSGRTENLYLLWPIAFFAGIWILMSNAMNYNHRFQYILMPMIWVLWLPVLRAVWPELQIKGWKLGLAAFLCTLMLVMHTMIYILHPRMFVDGRATLGSELAEFGGKGYTMAVTEAGNLPFYSDWNAIDTWGLNDKTISHRGIVSSAYLDAFEPELVMIHDYWSPGIAKNRRDEKWAVMTDTLDAYLSKRNYELVACWGRKPDNTHFYYLRKDIPDYESLKYLIVKHQYTWHEDGKVALNFLQEEK